MSLVDQYVTAALTGLASQGESPARTIAEWAVHVAKETITATCAEFGHEGLKPDGDFTRCQRCGARE